MLKNLGSPKVAQALLDSNKLDAVRENRVGKLALREPAVEISPYTSLIWASSLVD